MAMHLQNVCQIMKNRRIWILLLLREIVKLCYIVNIKFLIMKCVCWNVQSVVYFMSDKIGSLALSLTNMRQK